MVDISGNQIHAFSMHHALYRLVAWRRTAFAGPAAAISVFMIDQNDGCGCGALCEEKVRQLFADDLGQATEWHVQQKERLGMALAKL